MLFTNEWEGWKSKCKLCFTLSRYFSPAFLSSTFQFRFFLSFTGLFPFVHVFAMNHSKFSESVVNFRISNYEPIDLLFFFCAAKLVEPCRKLHYQHWTWSILERVYLEIWTLTFRSCTNIRVFSSKLVSSKIARIQCFFFELIFVILNSTSATVFDFVETYF